jgi:hypothetical protein
MGRLRLCLTLLLSALAIGLLGSFTISPKPVPAPLANVSPTEMTLAGTVLASAPVYDAH